MLNTASFLRPSSVEEAAALIGKEGAVPLAGGTDFIPLLKLGLKTPRYLVSLSGIAELKGARVSGGAVILGACATLSDIAGERDIPISALREAALAVASPQIRNRGTVGGNLLQDRRCLYFNQSESWRSSIKPCFKTGGKICHQIPNSDVCRAFYYSDAATALLALGSGVTVRTPTGERKNLPLQEALDGHLTANGGVTREKLFLTEIQVPIPRFSCFVKFASRASFDFPLLNLAAAKDSEGWRVFCGAWGARPARLPETERAILDEAEPADAEQVLLRELKSRREVVREAGLSSKIRESLPLRLFFSSVRESCRQRLL